MCLRSLSYPPSRAKSVGHQSVDSIAVRVVLPILPYLGTTPLLSIRQGNPAQASREHVLSTTHWNTFVGLELHIR